MGRIGGGRVGRAEDDSAAVGHRDRAGLGLVDLESCAFLNGDRAGSERAVVTVPPTIERSPTVSDAPFISIVLL